MDPKAEEGKREQVCTLSCMMREDVGEWGIHL